MKKDFKKPEFKLLKEFKAFITKGNVVDLAVGMIIGAAFTAIVTALVNNIFKPLINAIPMGDLQGLITMLVAKNAEGLTAAECAKQGIEFVADMSKSVYIDWGAFINAIINFLIIAFVLFCIVKGLNSLANARANLVGGVATDERKAVAAYRRQGMTKAQAKAKYAEDVAKAEAEKAEQERLEKEAEEAKATANTRLLEEIRDTLKALSEKG